MSFIVRRDTYGIPHVHADSLDDLFAGQGYATAQDRLDHLLIDRRRAVGTLAAITGERGHAVADAFARRSRMADHARAGYAALGPETQSICDAHAEGVNRHLAELGRRDIEPFEGWHAVATFVVRHLTFATFQTKLWYARVLAALGPDALARFRSEGSGADTPVIVPPGAREATGALAGAGLLAGGPGDAVAELAPLGLQLSGSNAWAVHGSRTRSGRPLIAGDPHRAFEAPNVYYQIGLHCPAEGIDACGFSFPGVPGVPHFAQTNRVAWAVTNAMADYQDLYVERLADALIDVRSETVEVAGSDELVVECGVTRHGPVVMGSAELGVGVALASAGLTEAGRSLRCVVPLLRAASVADLDAALADWVEPANNFVLADNGGDIAYRTAGWIPRRTEINAWLPVPGWTDEHDWDGFIAQDDLPRAHNPATGAIVTANQRVTARDYPHFLGIDAYPAHRADRIWARLGERRDLGPDDLAAIHLDTVSLPGLRFAGLASGPLAGWDGRMVATSRQAGLYGLARHLLVRELVGRLPEALRANPFAGWEPPATALPPHQRVANALDGWIAQDDRFLLDEDESWADLARAMLAAAETELGERTWGDLHHFQPLTLGGTDRLDLGPIDGGNDCVMATNQIGGVSTNALVGSTARYVWDLGDRSHSGWVVPLGAAAGATDQLEAYKAGRLLAVWE